MKLLVVAATLAVLAHATYLPTHPPKHPDDSQVLVKDVQDAFHTVNQLIVTEVSKYPQETEKTVETLLKDLDDLISTLAKQDVKDGLGKIRERLVDWHSKDVVGQSPIFEIAENLNSIIVDFNAIVTKNNLKKGTKDIKDNLAELWEVVHPDLEALETTIGASYRIASDAIRTLFDRVIRTTPQDFDKNIEYLSQAFNFLNEGIGSVTSNLVRYTVL